MDEPKIGTVTWEQVGPGVWRPALAIRDPWQRLSVEVADELHLGVSYDVLSRLIRAGFVESRRHPSGWREFNLHSWHAHVKRTRDPEFWAPGGPNVAKWRRVLRPSDRRKKGSQNALCALPA